MNSNRRHALITRTAETIFDAQAAAAGDPTRWTDLAARERGQREDTAALILDDIAPAILGAVVTEILTEPSGDEGFYPQAKYWSKVRSDALTDAQNVWGSGSPRIAS